MATGAHAQEHYASQVGELWSSLAGTLTRLETLGLTPELLAETPALDELRRLQYRLHAASEDAVGLTPPAAAESAHDELARALAEARDATGELIAAAESDGVDAVEERIYEWRGELFRVRLARLRLSGQASAPLSEDAAGEEPFEQGSMVAPLTALLLTLVGVIAFILGAADGVWPLWTGGAVALCCSLFVYRP